MKTAKYLCLLPLFLMAGNALYASGTRSFDIFYTRNSSSYDITISMEYWYGPGSGPPELLMDPRAWRQTVSGITLSIFDRATQANDDIVRVRPGQTLSIFEYSALGPPERFDKVVALPLAYKMNAIFKSLEITHNGGRGVITLADFAEVEVQRTVRDRVAWYVLEIFDMDDP